MKNLSNVVGTLRELQKVYVPLVIAGILFLPAASRAAGTPTTGSLFYTTFSGGTDVHDVNYTFNGTSLSFSGNTGIASTPGADGLVFTSDGFLAVGGQGSDVFKVNPVGGAFTTQTAGGDSPAYHMMVAPNGTIYSATDSGYSGPNNLSSYNSTLTVNGTTHVTSGPDPGVITLAWPTSDPTKAFYTASGPSGNGNFGTIDLTTGITTRDITGLPAAHGMTYDPYSGMLILMGAGHITEINPANPTVIVADLSLGGTYDQGTVDGKGHIFAANNDGNLTFIDYSSTKNIGTSDFIQTTFLAGSLDDVAPLVGAGSQQGVPEVLGFFTPALCLLGLCLFAARKHKLALSTTK